MASDTRPDAAQILAWSKTRRRRARLLQFIGAGLLAAGVGYFFVKRSSSENEQALHFVTGEAKISDLRETVTATGTLKGLNSVDVGAQISGRVATVLVDFNDKVTAGQVLAEIDPVQLKSRVEQSRAQVNAADASIRLARATVEQSKAQLERTRELAERGLMSAKDLEAARGDADRASASVASAEAQATLARATLKDATAALSWTTIRAPIDGIVLARLVEPGQTVAASLQSPVLFTIASDLRELQLYVDVDEADVGRVQAGQEASFAVDAWSNRSFSSRVVSVHNLPTAGQTVVSYQAVLSVANQELLLRPGMTATATIVTSEHKGVLTVPNAALRFTPPATPDRSQPALPFFGMRRGGFGQRTNPNATTSDEAHGVVWLLTQGKPKSEEIEIGGTDGESTEVKGGALTAGTPVIIDVEQARPK
jgi:HlyD family secretion protein